MKPTRRPWLWLTLALAAAGLADFLLGNSFAALAFLPMIAGLAGSLLGGGGGLGGALGGGDGGSASVTQGDITFGGGSTAKKLANQRLLIYVGGALAALALVFAAAWLIKRKK